MGMVPHFKSPTRRLLRNILPHQNFIMKPGEALRFSCRYTLNFDGVGISSKYLGSISRYLQVPDVIQGAIHRSKELTFSHVPDKASPPHCMVAKGLAEYFRPNACTGNHRQGS